MTNLYECEEGDFQNFWRWWLKLEDYALEILAPDKTGIKRMSPELHMMVAAYAATQWEKHKDQNFDYFEMKCKDAENAKLAAELREKGRELSKLKAKLRRRKSSKAKSKGAKK